MAPWCKIAEEDGVEVFSWLEGWEQEAYVEMVGKLGRSDEGSP